MVGLLPESPLGERELEGLQASPPLDRRGWCRVGRQAVGMFVENSVSLPTLARLITLL